MSAQCVSVSCHFTCPVQDEVTPSSRTTLTLTNKALPRKALPRTQIRHTQHHSLGVACVPARVRHSWTPKQASSSGGRPPRQPSRPSSPRPSLHKHNKQALPQSSIGLVHLTWRISLYCCFCCCCCSGGDKRESMARRMRAAPPLPLPHPCPLSRAVSALSHP